jgi:glycosyltransferase involved in cell wall biosynthesis
MGHPLVSVIIPVYNGERYLAQAIKSVLDQEYRPIEIIVVDDGSKDKSKEVALRFNAPELRYHFKEHEGQVVARNVGVHLAQGNFLAFLDADDFWSQEKLHLQMKELQAYPDLDAVLGHVKQFISPDMDEAAARKIRCPDQKMAGPLIGAMLIKRDAFFKVGEFDKTLRVGEFIDWYTRAGECHIKNITLPDIVLHRRLHDANMGILRRDSREEYLLVFKAFMDRKKKNQGV